jgi:hypothetical protein
MANPQDIASLGLDISRLKSDTEQAVALYAQVANAIQKLESQKATPGGLSDLIARNKQLTEVNQQLEKALTSLTQAYNNNAKASNDSASATKKQLDAFQQLQKEYKDALASAKALGAQYGETSQQFKDAATNAALLKEKIDAINAAAKAGGTVVAPTIQSTTNLPDNDAAAAATATGTAVSQLEQEEAAAAVAAQQWAAAQQQTVVALTESEAVIQRELTEYEALAEAIVATQAELNAINAAIRNNTTAFQQGLISEERYVEETAKLTIQQTELKQSLKQTQAEFNSQAKIIAGTSGAYDMLNARYIEAKKNAQDLAVVFGQDSVQAKAAAASAYALGQQLKDIDSSVNTNTRNVGKYASAFDGFGKAFGYLRTAANILPGIGIAGIIGLITDKITDLLTKLDLFKTKLTETAEAGKTLQEAIGGTEYKKAVEDVERLTIDIDLAKKGFLDKSAVVKEYNDTIGKTTGLVNDIDQAEQALIKNKEAYVQMMLYKAAATLELQKAAEAMAKAEEDRQKKEEEFASPLDFQTAPTNNGLLSDAEQKRIEAARQRDVKARKDAQIKEQTDAANQSLNIAKNFEQSAADLAKQFKFNFFSDNGGSNSNISNLKSLLQQLLKAQQEGEDILLQDQIKFHQAIADSDGFSYEERQRQAKIASDLRIKLIKENEAAELKQIQAAREEALQGYSDAETKAGANTKLTADQRNKILSDAANERNVAEAAFEQQRQNIIAKSDLAIRDEQIKTVVETAKLRSSAIAKDIADAKKAYEQLQAAQSGQFNQVKNNTDEASTQFNTSRLEQYNKDVQHIYQRYQNGEIKDYKKFLEQKEALDEAYSKASLGEAVNHYEGLIKNLKDVPNLTKEQNDEIIRLENELLKAKKALADADIKITTDAEKKKTDAKKKSVEERYKLEEKEFEIGKALIDLAGTIGDSSFQRELNMIQAKQDASDEYYSNELKNIQNSSISEQDKASKTIQLQAEQAEAQKKFDKEKRDVQVREARFAKAMQIATAIATTAQAVIAALAPPPVGLGNPAGIPFSIAAGVLGAVQIAKIAATQIPEYAEGTDDHKGGLAVVGEGKHKELVDNARG